MISSINQANASGNTIGITTKKETSMGKDDFLKLLTIQLKSQNPMKPIDNMEFATQLAQFSQLEQLTNIRTILENQNSIFQELKQTLEGTVMGTVLGDYATAYSNKMYFNGDNTPTIGYSLDSTAQKGEVIIKDASGREVRRFPLDSRSLEQGEHSITWDGTDNSGNKVPAGEYYAQIVVTNPNGSTFNVSTYATGKIEAIRFKTDGTVLVIDNIEIPLKNLISVKTKV